MLLLDKKNLTIVFKLLFILSLRPLKFARIKELKMSKKKKCLAVCTRGQYGGNKEQHGVNTTVP